MGEKLLTRYPNEDDESKQQRVQKAKQKEQLKGFVGMKLAQENQKLL